MQFMLIYIVYSLQYVVYCSILLSGIDSQPKWEFLSQNGQVAHAVVQFCGCEAKLLSWHWSKRLLRFDSLHVSVWIVPGSNDQMIKWWLRWLSMLSHPTFVRWNQKPRSAYLGSSDTSKSCSQNWSSSGILKCGFSYIEKGHLAGKLSKASNSLTWLVSTTLWLIVLRTSRRPRWWGKQGQDLDDGN